MRISIQIDEGGPGPMMQAGAGVSLETGQAETTAASGPSPSSRAPREVQATAAATGALDGGPAPSGPGTMPSTPPLPSGAGEGAPMTFTGEVASGGSEMSAGAAPGMMEEVTVAEIVAGNTEGYQ